MVIFNIFNKGFVQCFVINRLLPKTKVVRQKWASNPLTLRAVFSETMNGIRPVSHHESLGGVILKENESVYRELRRTFSENGRRKKNLLELLVGTVAFIQFIFLKFFYFLHIEMSLKIFCYIITFNCETIQFYF